ncbi:hypothetical protein H6778_01090 [Candidatus Nomurabacteria bacterium]|nr:hypothetical protein [Candidatus Nomurabacteria bacterium]
MKSFGLNLVLSVALFGVAFPLYAAVPATYTNENFFTSEQDAPVTFTQAADGSFSGMTEGGKTFYQRPVVSDIHVHLHRFSIDEAHFYISSLGLILADSDTVALSIYLARAGYIEVV